MELIDDLDLELKKLTEQLDGVADLSAGTEVCHNDHHNDSHIDVC
jgi:hypothetical protein